MLIGQLISNNVTSVSYFKEDIKIHHWNRPGLEGYIYDDVFDINFFNQLKNSVRSILELGDTKTYLTHSTTFNINNQNKKIIGHAQNNREQCVMYDISFQKDWYYQTSDTIKDWSDDTIQRQISPLFYRTIKIFENLAPFDLNSDAWVFYRLHLNYLEPKKLLALHNDAAPHLTKHFEGYIDHRMARMFSVTCYLSDHITNSGGELFTPYGFSYAPKANTALCINGNHAIHGVTQNVDSKPRMAFTIRAAHKDDLFLPGSPDKFLYDVTKNIL
jgi:hypothetical protein